jgi:hypothetical protein
LVELVKPDGLWLRTKHFRRCHGLIPGFIAEPASVFRKHAERTIGIVQPDEIAIDDSPIPQNTKLPKPIGKT